MPTLAHRVIIDVVYNHLGPAIWTCAVSTAGPPRQGRHLLLQDWRPARPGATRARTTAAARSAATQGQRPLLAGRLQRRRAALDSTVNIRTRKRGGGDIATLEPHAVHQQLDRLDASWKSPSPRTAEQRMADKTTGAGGAGFDSQWDAAFVHPIAVRSSPAATAAGTCTRSATPSPTSTTTITCSG